MPRRVKKLRSPLTDVNDIDLKNAKFNRLEAAGLDTTVRGLSKLLGEDRKLINQCCFIFDGLYEQFNENKETACRGSNAVGERKQ